MTRRSQGPIAERAQLLCGLQLQLAHYIYDLVSCGCRQLTNHNGIILRTRELVLANTSVMYVVRPSVVHPLVS